MKVEAISKSMTDAAETLQATLDKNTVIVLAVDDEGKMNVGWAGSKTINLLGLLAWGLTAIAEEVVNENAD